MQSPETMKELSDEKVVEALREKPDEGVIGEALARILNYVSDQDEAEHLIRLELPNGGMVERTVKARSKNAAERKALSAMPAGSLVKQRLVRE